MEDKNQNHKQALAAVISFALLGGSWQLYGAEAAAPIRLKTLAAQVASMTTRVVSSDIDADYVVATLPAGLTFEPGATQTAVVTIQNTSNETWDGNQLRLGTVFRTGDKDRWSDWQTETWLSPTRIAPVGLVDKLIRPRQMASFNVALHAPERTGQYREYFQPVMDGGAGWLDGQ